VSLLTVTLNFSGQSALVVGAGAVGRRKLAALLSAGAKIRVVEPNPPPWLLELASEGLLLLEKAYREDFLEDNPWVFLAGPPEGLTAQIAQSVRQRGLWLNTANPLPQTNFFLPAVFNDGPFRLAVTTGGQSPALAATVAKELRTAYQGYGAFCRFLGKIRPAVLESGLAEPQRKAIFQALARDPDLVRLLNEGQTEAARQRAEKIIEPVKLPADFSF
jgi:siroheme synthase-like protein